MKMRELVLLWDWTKQQLEEEEEEEEEEDQ